MQADAEAIHAPISGRDTSTKVLKILKTYRKKDFASFTTDEEEFWKSTITLISDGGLAKKTVKNIHKEIKNEIEPKLILKSIKRHISFEEFLSEEKVEKRKSKDLTKVILSEHFLG